MQKTQGKPLFDLGQLVATPGALAALEKSGQSPMDFLSRHVTGDWGELPEKDRKENQFSLEKGFRLMSSYRTHTKCRAVGDYGKFEVTYHSAAPERVLNGNRDKENTR